MQSHLPRPGGGTIAAGNRNRCKIDEKLRLRHGCVLGAFWERFGGACWKRGDNLLWYRDMKTKWNNYDVEIISDLEMPEKIDSGKTRLTVVKKL